MPDGRCHERLRGMMCSLAPDFIHDIHVAIDEDGRICGRWRMEAVELPLADALPHTINKKYL